MKYWRCAVFVFVLVLLGAFWSYAQTPSKPGHVYVLSNVGSFGEGVYKIGMTQRENPRDRVKELGDTSVPFPFDVHILLPTDDPRGLERKIHDELQAYRVNKINNRKEFFRVDLDTIITIIEKHYSKPFDVIREPESSEYRQTLELEKRSQ